MAGAREVPAVADRATTIAASGAPTDADVEVSEALGPIGGHLRDSILGVGGTGASIGDGIGDSSVGTALRPLDPMRTVLPLRFGPGDGRLHRFTAPGARHAAWWRRAGSSTSWPA